MRLKYRTRDFFKYGPSNFKIGIKNLIKYLPVIWTTRAWDHAYIDYLLLFKLKEMYPCLKDGHAAPLPANPEYWQGIKAMRICITILERRKNDFYSHIWNGSKEDIVITDNIEKRDWNLFCELFKTYHCYWWD